MVSKEDKETIICVGILFVVALVIFCLCGMKNKNIEKYINLRDVAPAELSEGNETMEMPKPKERDFPPSLVNEAEVIKSVDTLELPNYNLLNNVDTGASIQRINSQLKQPLPDAFSSLYAPVNFESQLNISDFKEVDLSEQQDSLLVDTSLETKNPGPDKASKTINIIMIYAPWCGWSKKALPEFDKLINDYHGKLINGTRVNVIKYNSDVDEDMVKKYKAEGFPTHILEIVTTSTSQENIDERDYNGLVSVIKKHV